MALLLRGPAMLFTPPSVSTSCRLALAVGLGADTLTARPGFGSVEVIDTILGPRYEVVFDVERVDVDGDGLADLISNGGQA